MSRINAVNRENVNSDTKASVGRTNNRKTRQKSSCPQKFFMKFWQNFCKKDITILKKSYIYFLNVTCKVKMWNYANIYVTS